MEDQEQLNIREKVHNQIKDEINSNKIVLYMKGSDKNPLCGFSAQVASILKRMSVTFKTIDVIENEDLRRELKTFSNWPTFPQLFIKGKLIGGCDIVTELYENGELEREISEA